MLDGWTGGIRLPFAAESLAVGFCVLVEDVHRPVEAVLARFAAVVAVPGISSAAELAGLVARMVEQGPSAGRYGLTFVASTDPLTTRLRTLTAAARATFLAVATTGPGRWVSVASDHHRWLVTRPWAMDHAFVGCDAGTARTLVSSLEGAVMTSPARHGRGTSGAPRTTLRHRQVLFHPVG